MLNKTTVSLASQQTIMYNASTMCQTSSVHTSMYCAETCTLKAPLLFTATNDINNFNKQLQQDDF